MAVTEEGMRQRRRSAAVASLVAVALFALVAFAVAAIRPQAGGYVGTTTFCRSDGEPCPTGQRLSFKVRNGYVVDPLVPGLTCIPRFGEVPGRAKIRSTGRFTFDYTAVGGYVGFTLRGKFVTPRRVRGELFVGAYALCQGQADFKAHRR
jgi:hypothetical protein